MRDNFSMAQNPAEDASPSYFFREWRKHRGYSQETLAEMVGLTASSISQLENGKQGFSDSTLVALAKALKCRPGDLLLWGPIHGEQEILAMLRRIDGLKPENVTVLLAAIQGFQQANAAQPERARTGDRSEPATLRRESSPLR